MKTTSAFAVLLTASLAIANLAGCAQPADISSADSLSSQSQFGSNYMGVLTLAASAPLVAPSGKAQFYASGGTPPYVYSVASGSGTVDSDSGAFTALTTLGSVSVEVRDVAGQVAYSSITVSDSTTVAPGSGTTTGKNAVTQVASAFDGVAGNNGNGAIGCPDGTSVVGTVANAGGSPPQFFGDRYICVGAQPITSSSTVFVDILVNSAGPHSDSLGCPGGYSQVGSVMDCAGGICQGQQSICGRTAVASTVSQYVTNFYVSPEGYHYPAGPGCAPGYSVAGYTVDCGGGFCSGYQHFCQLKGQ